MADYDLGTAHGKIRLDYDNRAAARAIADMAKMAQRMKGAAKSAIEVKREMRELRAELVGVATGSAGLRGAMDRITALKHASDGATPAVARLRRAVIGLSAGREIVSGLAKGMTRLVLAIGGLAAGAATLKALIVVIGGLAQALQQLSGLAGLLPGVIGGAVAAFATLKVGLLGVGDALKTVGGTAEEFNEAIKDLAPSAQATMRAIRGLKGRFDELRTAVQQRLFAGMADEIQTLADTYLPVLRKGMGQVAGQFNAAAKTVSSFLTEARTVTDVGTIFDATAATMGNLREAINPLLSALRDIAVVGVGALKDLSAGAGTAARRFAEFIAQARRSGDLRDWIDAGVQALKNLATIVKNVWQTIGSFFDVFTGGSTDFLGDLAEMTTQMNQFFSETGKGRAGLQAFADTVGKLSATFRRVLIAAFEELTPILRELKPFIDGLAQVIGGVLIGAIRTLGPLLQVVARALSAMSPVLVPLIGGMVSFGLAAKGAGLALRLITAPVTLVANGLTAVRGAADAAKAGFDSIKAGGKAAKSALDTVRLRAMYAGDAFRAAKTKVADWVSTMATATRTGFATAANRTAAGARRVRAALASAAAAAGRYVAAMARTAATGIAKGVAATVGAVGRLGGALARGAAAAGRWAAAVAAASARVVAAMARSTAAAVRAAAVQMAKWTAMAARAVAKAAVMAAAWLAANPIALIIAAIVALVALIIMNWDKIKAFLIATWNWIKQVAITVWNAIKQFFITLWNSIKARAVAVWNAIRNFFGQLWVNIRVAAIQAWNAIKAFFIGAWNRMKSIATTVWNAVKNFFTSTWNTIKSTFSNALNAVKQFVVNGFNAAKDAVWNAMKAIGRAVADGVRAVINFFKNLPGNILSALGDFGSLLWQAGKDLLTGLWEGIKAAFGWVMDKIKGIASSIANGFKSMLGIGSPSKVFAEFGVNILQGLVVGLRDNAPRVVALVRSIGTRIHDAMQQAVAKRIELTDLGRAAQQMLTHVRRGGNIFEDFSYRGNSDLVRSFNDRIADMFYAANRGFDFGGPGTGAAVRSFLQRVVDQQQRPVPVPPPRRAPTPAAPVSSASFGAAPMIGQVTMPIEYGVSTEQLVQRLLFEVRRVGKGVYQR